MQWPAKASKASRAMARFRGRKGLGVQVLARRTAAWVVTRSTLKAIRGSEMCEAAPYTYRPNPDSPATSIKSSPSAQTLSQAGAMIVCSPPRSLKTQEGRIALRLRQAHSESRPTIPLPSSRKTGPS